MASDLFAPHGTEPVRSLPMGAPRAIPGYLGVLGVQMDGKGEPL